MKLAICILVSFSLIAQDIRLERVTSALSFVLEHFPSADKFLPETMAGGLALFDYNNDGRIDIFFANGADMRSGKKAVNRLFRNDGKFKFTDVTEKAGLAGKGFAFGAAAADFDGDGFVDLYVPALPVGQLFHNRGDGTFEDWSSRLPQRADSWIVAAGWFDYDRDGQPDLFLVHYLDWSLAKNPWCGDRARDLRVYCHPRQFQALPNQLLHNLGSGKFEDVSSASGIGAVKGKGMSVAFGDANGDAWPDVYVTNDTAPCFLFVNQRNGKFLETGLESGVSLPDSGKAISAMGVDMRDFDNDAKDDIALTALARETFPLYRNEANSQFRELGEQTKLASLSTRFSGWGITFADLDNDGWKDLVTANSHVNDQIESTSADKYRQPNTVFRNLLGKQFALIPLGNAAAHRGLAVADLDNDGRLDLVITVLGAEAEIWRNTSDEQNEWLDIDAPLGTRIRIQNQTQTITSASGYSSSALIPAHFGLGLSKLVNLHVTWPDAKTESRNNVPTRQRLKLTR